MALLDSPTLRKLHAEQKHALDWTRSLAVRANAGSGKTTVLVERIVQLLHAHRDLTLDQIVAITFTRKAGAQLQERLHAALAAQAEAGGDARFWRDRLDELDRCPIGTIDAIAQRLLRRGIEAGLVSDLDPAFGILDELAKGELLDLALRETEIELADHADWDWWIRTQGRGELTNALRYLLGGGPVPAHDDATEADILPLLDLPALNEPLRRMADRRRELKGELAASLAEMRASPKGEGKFAGNTIVALEAWLLQFDTMSDFCLVGALRSALFTKTEGTIPSSGFADRKGNVYFPLLDAIQHEWVEWMPGWKFLTGDFDGFEQSRSLATIHAVARRHYRALCRDENQYDFAFLAERVGRMLDGSDAARRLVSDYRYILVDEFQDTNEEQWSFVARLAGADPGGAVTGDRLMIVGDPQQSIYRFRGADPTVFERTIGKIRAGNASRRATPTVADGDPDTAPSTPEQREGLMRLRRNYRSRHPVPLVCINAISTYAFEKVGTNPQPLEPGCVESDPNAEIVYLFPSTAADDAEEDGSSERPDDAAEPAAETLDGGQLEMLVEELRRQRAKGYAWGDMAILLRSRTTHFGNLEALLRAGAIPFRLSGVGFWTRQESRDLVSLANALANPSDELALFATLRGPLAGLTDSELLALSTHGDGRLLEGLRRIADPSIESPFPEASRARLAAVAARLGPAGAWRERVDRMPHADLLGAALDESGAWGIATDGPAGADRSANLRECLVEVRKLEASHPAALAATARRLTALVDGTAADEPADRVPEDADAVQVMTVHAAKGLEFPVVAVVGLERKFRDDTDAVRRFDRFQHVRPDRRDDDLARRWHGRPIVRFRHPEKPLEHVKPVLFQAMAAIERRRTDEEEARILHVALTRAESVLILAGACPKNGKVPARSWQAWVHGALGFDADIGEGVPALGGGPVRVVRGRATAGAVPPGAPSAVRERDLAPLDETPKRAIATTKLFELLEADDDARRVREMRDRHRLSPRVGAFVRSDRADAEDESSREFGRFVGTLVHRALEMGAAFPEGRDERRAFLAVRAAALADEAPTEDRPRSPALAAAALAILEGVLADNPFRELLDAAGESEVDFALPLGDGVVTGRFDRLIRLGGEWAIVDWKTDRGSPDAIVEKYRGPMRLYATALWESLPEGERPDAIEVRLAMTGPRETRTLRFGADELRAFRDDLRVRFGRAFAG
jgi:ATP-dependent helicase/nuclease subunit A